MIFKASFNVCLGSLPPIVLILLSQTHTRTAIAVQHNRDTHTHTHSRHDDKDAAPRHDPDRP